MLNKMPKSTLNFINTNIKNNAKSSSYPIRRLKKVKIISAPAITLLKLNTADEDKN